MDRVMRTVPLEEHTNVIRAVVLLRLAQALIRIAEIRRRCGCERASIEARDRGTGSPSR